MNDYIAWGTLILFSAFGVGPALFGSHVHSYKEAVGLSISLHLFLGTFGGILFLVVSSILWVLK